MKAVRVPILAIFYGDNRMFPKCSFVGLRRRPRLVTALQRSTSTQFLRPFGQFSAICPFPDSVRHSPSFMHFSRSAAVSLFSFTVWICTLPISIGTGPCLTALVPGLNVSLEGLIRLCADSTLSASRIASASLVYSLVHNSFQM